MNNAVFSQIDFGPLKEFLEEDNITDISYSNGGQVWLKTLDKGVYINVTTDNADSLIKYLYERYPYWFVKYWFINLKAEYFLYSTFIILLIFIFYFFYCFIIF